MLELRRGPLSVTECIEAVRKPGSGGIAVFAGAVRDHSEGKSVVYLEYEAYEPMALKSMEAVVAEVRSRWTIGGIAIQHRLGRLDIGEDAVVIAVSCPHRAEAFDACRYAIDRLKEIVPIWKKEFGDGGAVWVGGPTAAETSPVPGQD